MNEESGGEISVVLIGTSQGGFDALRKVLSPLPADLPVPILVVRHQSANTDSFLLTALSREAQLKVKFAEQGETPYSGTVYIAPPDFHLLVGTDGLLQLSQEEKVKFSRPAIDPLFVSAAAYYGPTALAVLLTGGNDDGTNGVVEIKKHGGRVLIQDPDSAVAPIMPRAALAAVDADYLIWLDQIGPQIWTLLWMREVV